MKWDVVERYRQMVDPATDYVLRAFGEIMAIREDVGRWYPGSSAGFLCAGLSSFDDLAFSSAMHVGKVAMVIVYSMSPEYREAITAIYVKGLKAPDEVIFLEAVAKFEKYARAKSIL